MMTKYVCPKCKNTYSSPTPLKYCVCGGVQISYSLFRDALQQHWDAIWGSMIVMGKSRADVLKGEAVIEAANFIHNHTPEKKEVEENTQGHH